MSPRCSALVFAALAACTGSTQPVTEAAETPTEPELGEVREMVEISAPTVHAAYVLWVGTNAGPKALARVIVDGEICPSVTASGTSTTMLKRDNPHGFKVTVCEQWVPAGQAATVQGWSTPLPAPSDAPTHPVIFGDTGCKHSSCAHGEAASPFDTLAAEAAGRSPDLVLHAGDFNYRGTGGFSHEGNPEYDAGDVSEGPAEQCQLQSPYVSQNAAYSDRKDTWKSWHDDLFKPAAPLLAAAPWIVTRGNHELCSRAGPGWFYFLDPSTNLDGTQLSCPPQDLAGAVPTTARDHIVLPEPHVVELKTLRVAVLDSANACDAYAPEQTTAAYTKQLAGLLASAHPTPTWLLTHRPTWGVSGESSGAITLQAALAASAVPEANLPGLMISGHMHQFQSVTFDPAKRPPQLVVGNGGVKLASPKPDGVFTQTVDNLPAEGLAIAHHGFLDVNQFSGASWSGVLVDKHKHVIGTCDSALPGGTLCAPAASQAQR